MADSCLCDAFGARVEGDNARSAPAQPGTDTAGSRAMLVPSLAARRARLCCAVDERAGDCETLSRRGSEEEWSLATTGMILATARSRLCLCTRKQAVGAAETGSGHASVDSLCSNCAQVNVEVEHAAGADDER
jgi:hypothetical protein